MFAWARVLAKFLKLVYCLLKLPVNHWDDWSLVAKGGWRQHELFVISLQRVDFLQETRVLQNFILGVLTYTSRRSKLMLCRSRPLNMVLYSLPMENREIHVELSRDHQLAVVCQILTYYWCFMAISWTENSDFWVEIGDEYKVVCFCEEVVILWCRSGSKAWKMSEGIPSLLWA